MKLVVAIDSAESASTALNHIFSSEYGKDLEIHLVHVIVPGFADVAVPGIPDIIAEEKSTEQSLLNGMTRTLRDKLGAKVTAEILTGETPEVIAAVCKRVEADEAIVPSHVRQGLNRLWFGSVADEIVEAAPCTVVVLKMPSAPTS